MTDFKKLTTATGEPLVPAMSRRRFLGLRRMRRDLAEEDLRAELVALNLPLVLLESHGVAEASIAVEDYGRLFIHLVHKL